MLVCKSAGGKWEASCAHRVVVKNPLLRTGAQSSPTGGKYKNDIWFYDHEVSYSIAKVKWNKLFW